MSNKYIIENYPNGMFGAKHKHIEELFPLFPKKIDTFFDPCGGSGFVSRFVKQNLDCRIVVNDVRRFGQLMQKVLVVNNNIPLLDNELNMLFEPNSNKGSYIRDTYLGDYGEDNADLLDNYASNISRLDTQEKKEVAIFLPIIMTIPLLLVQKRRESH